MRDGREKKSGEIVLRSEDGKNLKKVFFSKFVAVSFYRLLLVHVKEAFIDESEILTVASFLW